MPISQPTDDQTHCKTACEAYGRMVKERHRAFEPGSMRHHIGGSSVNNPKDRNMEEIDPGGEVFGSS